ncbi:MAG TPA: hypothetical protein VMT19_07590 [Thermoanaerobaculaceae bacterium]|nr:hypothetical protein [Thermoanaerobaculaceae bacterium]
MIAFQTLFLGLVFGTGPVRVMVSPPVVAAEVLLDGAPIGTVTGEPWEVTCTFGPSPLPHELVAIGRNAAGAEVGRARQWINLPRPAAEVRILVQDGAAGKPASARLAWTTIDNAKPRRFDVALDGTEIAVTDPEHIPLPHVDPTRPHFLSAEVTFPSVAARAEIGFGGGAEASATTELTAIPVVVRPGHRMPPVDALQTSFRNDGRPLRVLAVEEGHTDAVVVFDQDCAQRFRGITPPNAVSGALRREIPVQESRGGDRLYGMWAIPRPVQGTAGTGEVRGLFPFTIPLDTDVDDLRTLIFRFGFPKGEGRQQQLANAVATAGMYATSLNHRRAVAVILGEAPPDASTISVEAARAYLESIDVPLFVWTPERRIAEMSLPGWGAPDDISTDLQLQGAMSRLQNALRAQRVVWLTGSHLPQRVTLAPDVADFFLARGVVRGGKAGRR